MSHQSLKGAARIENVPGESCEFVESLCMQTALGAIPLQGVTKSLATGEELIVDFPISRLDDQLIQASCMRRTCWCSQDDGHIGAFYSISPLRLTPVSLAPLCAYSMLGDSRRQFADPVACKVQCH